MNSMISSPRSIHAF
jgi:hypothetical protein